MSLTPDVIDAMVASGCSVEQLAAVVKADLAAQERAVDAKRAKDAERQRRSRANRANGECHTTSQDVTVTKRDTPPCPPSFPPDPLTTPLNPPTPQKARERKATRLPADWEPTADDRDVARQEGLTDGECDREADKFRDYWTAQPGQRGVKRDWSATWRNWVRRRAEDQQRNRGGGNTGGGGKEPRSRLADYAEVAAELDFQSRPHPGGGHTPWH